MNTIYRDDKNPILECQEEKETHRGAENTELNTGVPTDPYGKDPALPLLELQLLNAIKMRYTFVVTTVSFLNLLFFLG